MKRIILIGNGFDRSLGFLTSYSNFLDWLFWKALSELEKVKPDTNKGLVIFKRESKFFCLTANSSLITKFREFSNTNFGYIGIYRKFVNLRTTGIKLEIRYRDNLIEQLYNNYEREKWVDIEQLYFDLLIDTKDSDIIEFNKTFRLIKECLAVYLNSLNTNSQKLKHAYNSYRKHFFTPRLEYNTKLRYWEETNINPGGIYFVNFNYTFILRDLLNQDPRMFDDKDVINHIHGDLSKPRDIVFGYGNENSDKYFEVEKKNNSFLENIKSNNYFDNTHYKDLLINLENQFEVYIYGLSCGLSDHILLKTIMEHKNCFQIRIFYKKEINGGDNFRETLINLSRAFSNKSLMRSRIISKQENDFIPQKH
ncbi:hypothetical protein HME9304_01465 [Flagellimonas maritima]|uniref:Bacteriophage abortive infection AbiH n=1 Tax=Flagellimonas maritima TaxID=1383885 RepID=A0A2Z4LSB0_9FLAO|nr:AbiH family protein [Allomuricauda aurantiaca]AWX44464.1 hypothetical protein HME9304_01465 [Allomuricauda aurantiaca]